MAKQPAHATKETKSARTVRKSSGTRSSRAAEEPVRIRAPRCQHCNTPVRVTWHVPNACKECGAAFDARPKWTLTLAFAIATAIAVGIMVSVRMALVMAQLNYAGLYALAGIVGGVVFFNLVLVVMFRTGLMRLTNVNAPGEGPRVALSPTDGDVLAKAEEVARTKNYAGMSKTEREADAQQLRESLRMAKAIRTGNAVADASPTQTGSAQAEGRSQQRAVSRAAAHTPAPATAPGRCRFRQVDETNAAAVRRLTKYGASMRPNIEYYLVYPPQEAVPPAPSGERRRVLSIGYVALSPQAGSTIIIDGFYLVPEERGRGYARSMMLLVAQRAHSTGCTHATAEVDRNNYQTMLVCEALGFVPVGEHGGNVVYDLEL